MDIKISLNLFFMADLDNIFDDILIHNLQLTLQFTLISLFPTPYTSHISLKDKDEIIIFHISHITSLICDSNPTPTKTHSSCKNLQFLYIHN